MKTDKVQTLIGVDVAKSKIDVHVSATDQVYTIANNRRSIGSWLTKTSKQFEIDKVVFEPTGGYENNLISQLIKLDIAAFYAHANHIVFFKKSHAEKAKTDPIDCRYISAFAQSNQAVLRPIKQDHMENKVLSELSKLRRQILNDIQRLKNHAEHAFFTKPAKKYNKCTLNHLKKELKKIEEEIDKEIKQDQKKAKDAQLLLSIPGVGRVTAMTCIADVPELGCIDHAKLSSLVGVAPFNRDSGKVKGRRCIYGGRAHVRKVIYMAALVATRYNPKLKEVYKNLRSRGKPAKVAIIAVARRLLRIMNAVVRDQKPYKAHPV